MRIIILGAGLVGVTTAYELSRSGEHDITVIDAADDVATEASGINAAMIAPGHAYAWASPKVPAILFKSFFLNNQAFRIKPQFDKQFWKWIALFLKQCNDSDAIRNTINKHNLCSYSQHRLGVIVEENQIEYDRIEKGLLYLYRNSNTFKKGVEHTNILQDNGQQLTTLNPDEVVKLEPGYKDASDKIAGAIYSPTDETGNSQIFSIKLKEICESRGVKFVFNTRIRKLESSKSRVQNISTTQSNFEGDLFIMCLGANSPLLLRSIGIDVPIYPIKGYSITFPMHEGGARLSIGTVDEDNLMACSPIGNELRATATAEFCGYNSTHRPKDFNRMIRDLSSLLPNAANYQNPKYGACLRPMTPQGTPYIGFSHRHDNLFVNSGHGHMGWTMSCGSAKIAADLILGRQPDIDTECFTAEHIVN